ncbi:MAG: transcription antitermination factor NusB [Rhodospirillales bacterium]|nr:MAG: transcription antitermination factor NusB [Rhodospirillales bacterium]
MSGPGLASADRRRRSAARLVAVQALYEIDVAGGPADPVLLEFLTERWRNTSEGAELTEPDTAFFATVVEGVCANLPRLDAWVQDALTDLTLDRLEVLLRVILRAGAFELAFRPDVPAKVVVNEYVDVAHAFFSGKETALVNAVLDKIARTIRPDGAGGAIRGDRVCDDPAGTR